MVLASHFTHNNFVVDGGFPPPRRYLPSGNSSFGSSGSSAGWLLRSGRHPATTVDWIITARFPLRIFSVGRSPQRSSRQCTVGSRSFRHKGSAQPVGTLCLDGRASACPQCNQPVFVDRGTARSSSEIFLEHHRIPEARQVS